MKEWSVKQTNKQKVIGEKFPEKDPNVYFGF